MAENFNYELHIFKLPDLESMVGKALAFFEKTPVLRLPPPRFIGCGVYALYYLGDFEPYIPLSRLNREAYTRPIYVGKAVPPGRRTGRATRSGTTRLYSRLREHMRNVKRGVHLQVDDFRCRFVILEDVLSDLIVPLESELIRRRKPLWNSVVDGFGIHDPGSGRYDQAPSEWDVLHPGRPWVERLTGEPPSQEEIMARVERYMTRLSLP